MTINSVNPSFKGFYEINPYLSQCKKGTSLKKIYETLDEIKPTAEVSMSDSSYKWSEKRDPNAMFIAMYVPDEKDGKTVDKLGKMGAIFTYTNRIQLHEKEFDDPAELKAQATERLKSDNIF